MILGLLAGGVLRSSREPAARVRWLVTRGVVLVAVGWLLGAVGLCPVVKRIWTPSFTLWSGGICLLFLAAFHHLLDLRGHARWAFFLVVIGTNSIAAYCIDHLFLDFVGASLLTHLGADAFRILGDAYFPLLQGAAILLVLWLILLWMYKRRIFLRI
jgi:predicted acyltransferase